MKRRAFAAFVLACVFSLAGAAAALAQSTEDVTRASAVTVASSTATERAYGAGVIVGLSGTTLRVLTAKHVVTFGPTLTVALDRHAPTLARLVYADPGHDLAVLEADVSPDLAAAIRPVRIGASLARRQALHLWGQLDGLLEIQRGDVALTGGMLPDGPAAGRFAFTCGACHEGDSGAGVFSADGTLVGIYLGFYETGGRQGLSVATLPAPMLAWMQPATAEKVAATVGSSMSATTRRAVSAGTLAASGAGSPDAGAAGAVVPADMETLASR